MPDECWNTQRLIQGRPAAGMTFLVPGDQNDFDEKRTRLSVMALCTWAPARRASDMDAGRREQSNSGSGVRPHA
jgi:hypothetical protein